jgi:hypothetical protein
MGGDMETFSYRKRLTDDGLPQVVEAAFAALKEGTSDDRRIITGVNWSSAITANPFRTLGRVGDSLDSVLAQQRAGRAEPILFLLHVACPRVEFADRGKSAVVMDELVLLDEEDRASAGGSR